MTENGLHPLEILATSSLGTAITSQAYIDVKVFPFLGKPAALPQQKYYYAIKNSQIDIILDFSASISNG